MGEFIEREVPNAGDVTHAYGYRIENKGSFPVEERDDVTCGHCRGFLRGYAGIDSQRVCHPDVGLDCYRLVTVYRHPLPCPACHDVRVLMHDYEEELEQLVLRRHRWSDD